MALREDIARMLNPQAMQTREEWIARGRQSARECGASPNDPNLRTMALDAFLAEAPRRQRALEKADAILALIAISPAAAWRYRFNTDGVWSYAEGTAPRGAGLTVEPLHDIVSLIGAKA